MDKKQSTAVVSIEDQVKQQLALQQQKAAALQTGPNLISFKGGQLIVDGIPIPGGEAEVYVLAQQAERAFYAEEFDSSKPQVPACYSFDLEAPHPDSSAPQHEQCLGCPQNEWGSASRGRGKACRESTRVAVVPATAPLETAPMYQCSFPITSVGSVKEFLGRCAQSGKLSGEFKTRLKVVPDPKSFFKASLTPLQTVEQPMRVLLDRMAQARDQLMTPYPTLEAPAEPEPPKGKSKKF